MQLLYCESFTAAGNGRRLPSLGGAARDGDLGPAAWKNSTRITGMAEYGSYFIRIRRVMVAATGLLANVGYKSKKSHDVGIGKGIFCCCRINLYRLALIFVSLSINFSQGYCSLMLPQLQEPW